MTDLAVGTPEKPIEELLARFTTHDAAVASNPADGKLNVWRCLGLNTDGYIPVGAVGEFSTGVGIDIPEGVTVKVRGTLELEARRIRLNERDYVGPLKLADIVVALVNESYSSGKLTIGDQIAVVGAYFTPPKVRWEQQEC